MLALEWPLATIPEVRLAGRFPIGDRGFQTTYLGPAHALHLHDYHGRMQLGGRDIRLQPGDVTISPLGSPTAYDLDVDGRHWCIHFRGRNADAGDLMTLPLHIPLGTSAAAMRERMAHVARLHARAESPIAAASAAVALQDLLLWLADRDTTPPAGTSPVEKAASLIDERFQEPLTAAGIAREVGVPQYALARRFRARFGTTMPHRLIQRRAEHARYLLESTDLPIWRVAERVGIPDPHHFNKTVRRLLGASPSAVRRAAFGALPIDPDR